MTQTLATLLVHVSQHYTLDIVRWNTTPQFRGFNVDTVSIRMASRRERDFQHGELQNPLSLADPSKRPKMQGVCHVFRTLSDASLESARNLCGEHYFHPMGFWFDTIHEPKKNVICDVSGLKKSVSPPALWRKYDFRIKTRTAAGSRNNARVSLAFRACRALNDVQ